VIDRVPASVLYPERRLYLDVLGGRASATRWLPERSAAVEARRRAEIRLPADAVQALREYHHALTGSPATRRNVEALGDAGTVCVVAGQQAGFLGSPLLTAHKIVSAVRAAERIGRELGVRAVPIFWLASEDHDFGEIHRARYVDGNGDLRTISFDWADRGRPIEAMPSGPALEAARVARDSLGLGREWETFEPDAGDDYARWHARIWLRLFSNSGLVVVEPRLLRPFGGEIVDRAVAERAGIKHDLARRAAALRGDGYEPPLDPATVGGVFVFDCEGRRVRPTGEIAPGEARRNPERFSPDVALRPVVADALLPTVANVLGPSELEYHAMLEPIYRRLEVAPPAAIPRSGFTLLTVSDARLLERLGAEPADVLTGRADLSGRVRAAGDPELAARFAEVRAMVARALAPLESTVEGIDPGLAARFRQVRDRADREIEGLADRAARADLARRGLSARAARAVAAFVRPAGQPQERVLSVVHAVSRHGLEWVDALIGLERVAPGDHCVVIV